MGFYNTGNILIINKIALFSPLLFWVFLIYINWWQNKKSRWELGKVILIPIIIPFIYTFGAYMVKKGMKIPFDPEWPLCFTKDVIPRLKKLNVISSWDWSCGDAQNSMTFQHINYIQDKIYYITYAILLIGILSTGFKKMAIFNEPLIRNFTITALVLALFGNSMRWLNDYGLYSEFLAHSLGVILSMALASFIIIILGLGSGIGRY